MNFQSENEKFLMKMGQFVFYVCIGGRDKEWLTLRDGALGGSANQSAAKAQ